MYQYLLIDKNITPLSHFHNVITSSSFFYLHVQVNAIFCHTETSQSIYSICFVYRQYLSPGLKETLTTNMYTKLIIIPKF